MQNKKKITALVLSAIGISLLALAGRQVADKYKRPGKKIIVANLPPAKDEYTKLVEHFFNPDSVSVIKGTIRLYDGENPGIVKEKSDFISVRDGRSFYSKMSFVEIISNGKWYVQIDSLHKLLLIAGISGHEQPSMLRPDMG